MSIFPLTDIWLYLYMIYGRFWTVINFVINISIILLDRHNTSHLSILLRHTRLEWFTYDICQWWKIHEAYFFLKKRGPYRVYHYWIYYVDISDNVQYIYLIPSWNENYEYSLDLSSINHQPKFEIWDSFVAKFLQIDGWNHLQKCYK